MNRPSEADREAGYFTRHMFFRQYKPALISALALSLGDMADALVIGNRMGAVGLAAIAFALPIFMVYNVIMHSFGLGGSIRYAKQMTEGDDKSAVSGFQGVMSVLVIIGFAILVFGNLLIHPLLRFLGASADNQTLYRATLIYVRLLLISAPLFFLAYGFGYYLRNDDLEKEASLAATIGNISDLILNIVLVLFCGMGVTGAGIATMSGVALTTSISLFMIVRKGSHLKFFPFRPMWKGVFSCFRTGFSSCISYVYSMFFLLIGNNAMMRLAGEVGVAVFDVIQNITYFFTYLYGAISQASQPIFSTYEGEKNYDGSRSLLRLGMSTGLLVGGIVAALLAVAAPWICMLFGLTGEQEIFIGVWAIRIFCVGSLFAGASIIIANSYLSRGSEFPAFFITTLRGAAILIPATLALMNTNALGFWLLYPVTEILSLTVFMIYRQFRRKEDRSVDSERIFRATLHNKIEEVSEATVQIESFCEKWEAEFNQLYFVQMTVEEVCTAIITGGFGSAEGPGIIELTLVAEEMFNPFELKREEVEEDESEDLYFSAVGMDVIRAKAKEFFYRRYQGFNTLVVKV